MNILSLLRALSHRNIRGGRRTGRTPIRKRAPYRPRIEPLEDRSMLSSILMLPLDDGTFQLRIEGDAKPNQVAIVGRGPGDLNNDYSLMVTCDQLQQTVNNVSEVYIDTAGGADTVLLNGQWEGVRSISADLGNGADTVLMHDNALLKSGPITLTLTGGMGDDKVSVMNNTFAGTVTFFLELNGGDDVATMHNNLFSGDLNLTVTGDAGNDVLLNECNAIAGSFDTSVDLGRGTDTVTFTEMLVTGPWQLTVNCGDGDDVVDIGGENDEGTMAGNQIGGGLIMKVIGGNGSDTVAFHGNTLTATLNNVPPADVFYDMGSGEDTLNMEANTFGGSLNLSAIGGVGGDAMSLEYNSVSGSASVTLNMGQGDDEAILEQNYFLNGLNLQIGGGAGKDLVVCAIDAIWGTAEYDISLDAGDDIAIFEGNYYNQGLNMTLDAGRGDDTATFEGNVYDRSLKLFLDAGDGRDTVAFHGNSLAAAPSVSELAGFFAFVDLGRGDDKAMFALDAYTGSLLMTVLGGDGKDLVTVQCSSIGGVGGSVDVLVELGDGRDTADVNLTLLNQDPAQHKPITVRVLGGNGDDDLALSVKADTEMLAAANLFIDGGSGFDHGMSGPFVKIYNCEQ